VTDEQIGAAIRSAAATVAAPPALRARLAAPARRRRRVPRLALGVATAAVAVVLALVVTNGGPTVQDVAAAALRAPTAPAAGTAGEWSAVGRRTDSIDGRQARTIVFRRGGRGVHYAILGGAPIAKPEGRTVRLGGHPYTVLNDGRTAIVTWRAGGHTCVLASRQAGTDELLRFLHAYYA
jgi:hypothetical protein